jgi:tetratricopeptide (TPR) repeat protein
MHGPALIAGTALSLFVLLVIVGAVYLRARPSHPQTAAASGRPPTVATATRPIQRVEASQESGFLDHKRGGSQAYAQGDYAAAADRYRQAIADSPSDADALNNLGQVLTRMGEAEKAIPYLERANELYPNVWTYRFNLARAYGQTGDWHRAVAGYRSALELFPDDYVTQFNLAHALHKQGNEEEAVIEYRKAITLAPGEPSFHLSLAISYETLGRSNDAVESYRRYLEIARDSPEAQKVRDRIQGLTSSASIQHAIRSPSPVPAPAQ